MKDDLIRRRDALAALNKQQMITKSVMRRVVMQVPAVDAVEVVRCKDCEYAAHCEEEGEPVRLVCPMWGANCDENEFCSRGDRRENDI